MMTTVGIDASVPPSGPGCADCDNQEPPGWWFHLRRCAQCGHVGCCDSSPGRHGTAHWRATGHRYIQSYEPGEDWIFDFEEQTIMPGPELAPPSAHPADQPSPGPAGRVPPDWMSQVPR